MGKHESKFCHDIKICLHTIGSKFLLDSMRAGNAKSHPSNILKVQVTNLDGNNCEKHNIDSIVSEGKGLCRSER